MTPESSHSPPPGGSPPRQAPGPYSLLFYFLRTLRPSPWRLAVIVAVILTSSTVPVAIGMLPAIMARLWTPGTVEVFGHARQGAEWLWTGAQLFVVVTVVFMALQMWQQWLAATVGEGALLELRDRLFVWLGHRSLFGDSPGSLGEIVQRMTGDAQQLRQLLFPGVLIAAIDLCRVVYTLVALAALEPRVTLVLALGLGLVLMLSGRLHRRLILAAARDRDVNASLSNQMIEASAGSRDLIAAGRFDRFADTFRRTLQEKRRLALTTTYWGALAGSAMPFFITLAIAFYYLFSVRGCCSNAEAAAEVGRITSFAFLLGSFQQPVAQIAGFRAGLVMAMPAMLSLRSAMDQVGSGGATPPPSASHVEAGEWTELRVAGVSYHYPGAGGPALRDISFTVPRGSFTGIVGESGSGKSTLAYVLLGTLRPDSGFAGFAGPSGMTPFAAHRDAARVGYIPQQPFIFDTSIRDNILMGLRASEVTEQELRHVVELAQLSALVSRRAGEGGLDAPCGPGGRLLSGGERQRIALARALLAKPDVIICDEYTANIDAKTALLIHHSLLTEFSRQTRIVVSHQLYALRGADQLVVLQEGAVSGVGSHADLVVSCDAYRTFWDLQRLEVS